MKVKKGTKFLLILCCGLLMVGFLCGFTAPQNVAFAAETEISEEVTETAPETAPEPENKPSEPQTETVLTRIESWFSNNLVEFLSGTDLVMVTAMIVTIIKDIKKGGKNTKEICNYLKNTNQSNEQVVDTVNTMIGGYNEIKEFLEALKENGLTLAEFMKNVTIYGKATLEILAAVYANNKNIPQATKDLVQLKYVETLKLEAGYKIDEEVKAAGEAEENTENTDAETVEEG